jgi:D-serine deaminase-like pyridoxal phosphate-dependent protein
MFGISNDVQGYYRTVMSRRSGKTDAEYDAEQIARIRRRSVPATEKGFGGPAHRSRITVEAMVAERRHVRDGLLGAPRVLLREAAMTQNIDAMAQYCQRHDVTLFPHGKTTMAPQLWARQLAAGAGGITVATPSQARLARKFGVQRVLVANEIVDEGAIRWVAQELSADSGFSFLCYVDSLAGVELLERVLATCGFAGRLPVLVELGHENGRTGARGEAAAVEVADAVGRSGHLELAGIAGYEGSLVAPSPAATADLARSYCERIAQLTLSLLSTGHFAQRPVVSAGGSAYFDVVVEVLAGAAPWDLVLRSGCYLTHDHGTYARLSPFERAQSATPVLAAALEVWAPVLSRPEPSVAVLGVGRRDVSSDAGNPVVLGATHPDGSDVVVGAASVERLFDQHAVATVPPDSGLAVGDEVRLGISHPCTTFDKWRWIPVVDDEDLIVDVVRTFF